MNDARWTERLEGPAEVRAYQRVFRYRHLGRGRPLLLLPSPDGSWRMASELVDGLSGHFRLIVPDVGPAGADLTCWLACFLEGLGVRAVGVVAAGCFRVSISDLVSRDPGQVGRVVVVVDGAPQPPAPPAAPRPVSGRVDASVLEVSRADLDVPSTLTTLTGFLGERPPRSAA